MSDWTVPLTDLVVEEADIEAVVETYRSGWLTMGPRTLELEEAFARYTGAKHAVAVANGTAALHLICLAADIGPGDEVIVPSLTFVATANAVMYTGAKPVFADIAGVREPWLSAEACEAAIGEHTKAILAVAYGGHSGEIEALRALCDRHGIALLEDAAHAAGSRLRGQHVGTFGAAAAFSLFSNKNLAVGEGGLVVTGDDALAERVRLLRSHGMTTLTWDRHRAVASSYDVVALGFNYRIDEPRAALATRRLERLDAENRQRRRLDAGYRAALERVGVTCALSPPEGLVSSHHLFTIVLDESADRDSFRARLAERGIQTSVHYPPVHRFAIYADGQPELPLTCAYASRAVSLPLYPHMTGAHQELVLNVIADAVQGAA